MEIQRYMCCIFVNCVILFPSLSCKPVSLNDIIAAEEQRTTQQASRLKVSDTNTNLEELSKSHKIYSTIYTKTGNIIPTNKKTSALKYKKTFQIRTPLRPKRIKYSYKPRIRWINTTAKREINKDENINRNHIPLLKSLGVFFNNILSSDTGEDDDTNMYHRGQHSISAIEECPCAHMSQYKTRGSEQAKEATISASPFFPQNKSKVKAIISAPTSSTPTHNIVNDNIGSLGRNKNVPILSARNSSSSWRNYNGFGKGSLSAHYRNLERHITGNNRDDENYNSTRGETASYTEDYKQYTNSSSGDYAGSNGFNGAISRNANITSNAEIEALTSEAADIVQSNEALTSDRGDCNQSEGHYKFETRRNETEGRELLLQSDSRLRGYQSQETTDNLWQIQDAEKSNFDITHDVTSNQRFTDRDGGVAAKDHEIRRSNETLTLDNLSTSLLNAKSFVPHDTQIVVIYDGYSIARDVNGENKLSEKAYRIHS